MAAQPSTSLMAPSSPVRSPWHSPIPYLFGGLAAMMALIAFALLFLACSYWKLSRNLQRDGDGERDLEAGDGKPENNKTTAVIEDSYLVIMAGQEKPTFIATPSSSRTSSFGSCSCQSSSTASTEDTAMPEKENDESSDRVQVSTTGNREA